MRSILIAAVLAAGPAIAAQEMIAKSGDDHVRLIDAPCPYASVLMHIPEANRKAFRKADARVGGQRYFACFALKGDQVIIVYEDGDLGQIPAADFKEAQAI
jgi:hypothetical protein